MNDVKTVKVSYLQIKERRWSVIVKALQQLQTIFGEFLDIRKLIIDADQESLSLIFTYDNRVRISKKQFLFGIIYQTQEYHHDETKSYIEIQLSLEELEKTTNIWWNLIRNSLKEIQGNGNFLDATRLSVNEYEDSLIFKYQPIGY